VWLETPERLAALARRTVIGWLVYSSLQRPVRLALPRQAQQVPGHTGATATPTAVVVLALLAQVALGQGWLGEHAVVQVYGVPPHHLLICDALSLDHAW
jgi:anti-sigma factor RsiW